MPSERNDLADDRGGAGGQLDLGRRYEIAAASEHERTGKPREPSAGADSAYERLAGLGVRGICHGGPERRKLERGPRGYLDVEFD